MCCALSISETRRDATAGKNSLVRTLHTVRTVVEMLKGSLTYFVSCVEDETNLSAERVEILNDLPCLLRNLSPS